MLLGAPVDRSEVARDLIRRLDRWYDRVLRRGVDALSDCWRDRSEHLGRMVRVLTPEGTLGGRLVGLDLREGLTLELHPTPDHDEAPSHDGPPGSPLLRRVDLGKVLSLEGERIGRSWPRSRGASGGRCRAGPRPLGDRDRSSRSTA
ncbi:MAG: hypothetical protein U0790_01470 [Isosphaeraceae bacterium]